LQLRTCTSTGVQESRWGELCLQASTAPESLDDQFMELRELGVLFKNADQAGVAGSLMMILHRVSEMLRPRGRNGGKFFKYSLYRKLKLANPDDSVLETRLNLWRIRGGLYATAVRELPPGFELLYLGPIDPRGPKDNQANNPATHFIAFPSFGGSIPDDVRTTVEEAPTWNKARMIVKGLLGSDGAGPWTTVAW
jgi:hypothetical protein